MSAPSSKPQRKDQALVPDAHDVADVQAGIDAAERGDALSAEESAAYVRSLIGDEPAGE